MGWLDKCGCARFKEPIPSDRPSSTHRAVGTRKKTFLVLVQGMPLSSCSQRVSPLNSPCEKVSGEPLIQWKRKKKICGERGAESVPAAPY